MKEAHLVSNYTILVTTFNRVKSKIDTMKWLVSEMKRKQNKQRVWRKREIVAEWLCMRSVRERANIYNVRVNSYA